MKIDILGHVAVDQTFVRVTQPSDGYRYTWNGKDIDGNLVPGSALAHVNLYFKELAPSNGDHGYGFLIPIGNFKAITVGLGGWTLSPHHFLDLPRKIVYLGDGSTQNFSLNPTPDHTETLNPSEYRVLSRDQAEVFIFDPSGRHLRTLHSLTGATLYQFAYDSKGQLSSITDSYQNKTTVVRNASGVLTGIRAPYGQVTTLGLDVNGYLARIRNPNKEAYHMTYADSGGLLSTFQKPKGQVSTFLYDGDGLLLSDLSSSRSSSTFSIIPDSTPKKQTIQLSSALGRKTVIESQAYGSVVTQVITNPDGTISRSTSLIGESTSQQTANIYTSTTYLPDPRFQNDPTLGMIGNSGKFIYYRRASDGPSNWNQQTTITPIYPTGLSSLTPFNFATLDKKILENEETTTDILYTQSTRQTMITTPEHRQKSVTIDPFGKITNAQLATLAPISMTYDPRGNPSTVTQGARKLSMAYNSSGQLDTVTNALGQITRYTYDQAGRVLTQTLPDMSVIEFEYDLNGNLKSLTTPQRASFTFGYNAHDLVHLESSPPLSDSSLSRTVYTYNDDKQVVRITRPNAQSIVPFYDAVTGQLTSIKIPQGWFTYTYKDGKVQSATSPDQVSSNTNYSGEALVSEDTWIGQRFASLALSYDNYFRLSQSNVTDAAGMQSSIPFRYDQDQLLITAGAEALVRDSATGLLNGTRLGQITDSYSYDPSYGEETSYLVNYAPPTGSTQTLFNQAFTRDDLGRILSKLETVGGVTHSYAYNYDASGRLTDVLKDGASYSHYNYDPNGNRISGLQGNKPIVATYDSQDRLIGYNSFSVANTPNGEIASIESTDASQARTFLYDEIGNLKKATLPGKLIRYLYDAFNRRVARKVGAMITQRYVYENNIRIGALLDGSGNLIERFVYGSKVNVPDYMIQGGTTYRIISDERGSVRLVVDSATGAIAQQIEYDEFGQVLLDTKPGFVPFGFAGCLYDQDTKLCHFGAREYDAQLGRWISKDPIGFAGGDTNLYGYVLNDPVNLVDPSGENALAPLLIMVTGIGVATWYIYDYLHPEPKPAMDPFLNHPPKNLYPDPSLPPGTHPGRPGCGNRCC